MGENEIQSRRGSNVITFPVCERPHECAEQCSDCSVSLSLFDLCLTLTLSIFFVLG